MPLFTSCGRRFRTWAGMVKKKSTSSSTHGCSMLPHRGWTWLQSRMGRLLAMCSERTGISMNAQSSEAPSAVAPHRQGDGIGSGLMNELLRQAERIGEPLLVLLGLPAYYGRFGFESAGTLGIDCPSVGLGNPHFLIHKLTRYSSDHRGEFRYCWEFTSG